MNNQEFQLTLIYIILMLSAIAMLLFFLRCIKILTTKKIENKDDLICFLFIVGLIAIPVFLYRMFKTVKGDPKKKY